MGALMQNTDSEDSTVAPAASDTAEDPAAAPGTSAAVEQSDTEAVEGSELGAASGPSQDTSAPTDAAPAPPQEPARSPAEAFAELAAQIGQARRDIAQVADYARGTGAQLQRAVDGAFLDGADAALRGLIRIDELLFKQTRGGAGEAMDAPTAALAAMLAQAVEGELRALDVSILEPHPGDDIDLASMVAIANRPAPLLRMRRADTVAEVITRGYAFATEHGHKILKKAEVVVWRHRDDIAFDGSEASQEAGTHE